MNTHHRTKCFILTETERGEADKVFSVFSKDFGKLQVFGKGIRKTKSKLRGGIPLFSVSEIEFIQGNRKTLIDTLLIKEFLIKKDLKSLEIASAISENFNALVKGEEQDLKIWDLLNQVFGKLSQSSSDLIFYYFLWNLFEILGYKPELYSCLVCKKKLEPNNLAFSKDGGIICKNCVGNGQGVITIDPNTIKILREILKKDLEGLLNLKIKKNFKQDLERVSDFYLEFLII